MSEKASSVRNHDLFFIAGPCVAESDELCLRIADKLAKCSADHNTKVIFKASYDKANRTSAGSFRGLGMEKGLSILEKVKAESGLDILTDIHTPQEAGAAAQVVDVLQIPAFLCRQTDLLSSAGKTGKVINIKKGQFLAPADMKYAVEKAGGNCWITERGTFFGYNKLVVDYTGLHVMKEIGVPVIFDATHSVQAPGGGSGCSSGNRDLAIPLAKAAVCQGIQGLFFEVHPDPDNALCDGPNSLQLDTFIQSIPHFIELHQHVDGW